jgi:hypothetical protein
VKYNFSVKYNTLTTSAGARVASTKSSRLEHYSLALAVMRALSLSEAGPFQRLTRARPPRAARRKSSQSPCPAARRRPGTAACPAAATGHGLRTKRAPRPRPESKAREKPPRAAHRSPAAPSRRARRPSESAARTLPEKCTKGAAREETGAALARRLAVLTVSPKMLPTDVVSAANDGHVVCSGPSRAVEGLVTYKVQSQ